jgi:hypothetical protein
MKRRGKLTLFGLLALAAAWLAQGCQTAVSTGPNEAVMIPFLKNTPNECYFLDEFMPVPDGLVSGKNGSLDLRYYTYKTANYKDWRLKGVMLSFYSRNGRCWSLFEEYYIAE